MNRFINMFDKVIFLSYFHAQSAKPGYKAPWQNPNTDEWEHSRKVKLLKPDLTTNDFARIMPKKIHQDKERLYSEGLQLKQQLNEVMEENIRLKTRIAILQKEKEKMSRCFQTSELQGRRTNLYAGGQKQNLIVRNLKKLIRQNKQENQFLKQQNTKIKKAIKYTKINQLQIERKMMYDEHIKMNQKLQEMNQQLQHMEECQRQIQEISRQFEDTLKENEQISEENKQFAEEIQRLMEQMKSDEDKYQNREKKYQRQIAINKRKFNQTMRQAEDLRKQLKFLKEQKKQKKPIRPTSGVQSISRVRPTSSNTYKKSNNLIQVKQKKIITQSRQEESKLQVDQVKAQNDKLQKQLQETKKKLLETQLQKSQQQAHNRQTSVIQKNIKDTQSYDGIVNNQQQKHQPNNLGYESSQEQYQQSFQKDQKVQQVNDAQIEKYKKQFQEHSDNEAEQLYAKDDKQQKKKKKDKKKKYKPNTKILSELKQLLTYRMKAQRYPYSQLKKDINNSQQTDFSYTNLVQMLSTEPFYLNNYLSNAFLSYCFQKEKVKKDQRLTSQKFLQKLRKLISDFSLIEEQVQEQRLISIANMVTQYPEQLEQAFQQIKNGQETCSKQALVEMFKKFQLQDIYVELIIAQMSLFSQDLQHLNFHGFFKKFYFDNEQEYANQQIQEQREEQSYDDAPPIPKSKVKKDDSLISDDY